MAPKNGVVSKMRNSLRWQNNYRAQIFVNFQTFTCHLISQKICMIREREKKKKRGNNFMCHIDVTTESECYEIDVTTESECILQTLDFVLRTL